MPHEVSIIRESSSFISTIIKNVKIDFVHDPLSLKINRNKVLLQDKKYIVIDTIINIVSNKLCTLASRSEPKDFIDLYCIFKLIPRITFDQIYEYARQKDALFDDPPTAAFQIEENFKFVTNNPEIMPQTLIDFDINDWSVFYKKFIRQIYKRYKPEGHI